MSRPCRLPRSIASYKQHGLSERELLTSQAHKKFEAERANQIWQADMLFGPWVLRPGGGRIQVFLHATLDDASRLIPHAQFYPNQGLDSCLDCLRQAMQSRGIPTRLISTTPRCTARRNWPASPPR